MTIEEIKELSKQSMIETIKKELDSAIIFTYIKSLEDRIKELEEENKKLKENINKALDKMNSEIVHIDGRGYYYISTSALEEILKGEENES